MERGTFQTLTCASVCITITNASIFIRVNLHSLQCSIVHLSFIIQRYNLVAYCFNSCDFINQGASNKCPKCATILQWKHLAHRIIRMDLEILLKLILLISHSNSP